MPSFGYSQALSPALMEGYLRAASKVTALAIGDLDADRAPGQRRRHDRQQHVRAEHAGLADADQPGGLYLGQALSLYPVLDAARAGVEVPAPEPDRTGALFSLLNGKPAPNYSPLGVSDKVQAAHAGGIEWTIKDGIPYHVPTLMREVKEMVSRARASRAHTTAGQP